MDFEWAEEKDALNRAAHKIGFDEAIAVWADPAAVTIPTTRAEDKEDRFKTIGFIEGRLFVVVWTRRDGRIRVISARRTNAREEKAYGQAHPQEP